MWVRTRRGRPRWALALALIAGVVLPSAPAHAAPIQFQNRITGYFPDKAYGGNAVDGVTGSVYVRNNAVATTGTTANVNLYDAYTGNINFIQAGVVQGDAKLVGPDGRANSCGADPEGVSAPTFFVGYQTSSMSCERLESLGTFGSTGNYRKIGIRYAGSDVWYVTLDGVEKWRKQIVGLRPGNLRPQFSGETNDTCTTLYARAEATTVNKANLAFHTNGGTWTLWPKIAVDRRLYHPTLYSISAPHAGTPAAMWAWGPTSKPGEC